MKKKLYSLIILLLSCQVVTAESLDSFFNNGTLSREYYTLTESKPDLVASVILYPLIWDYSSDNISAFSGGGSFQFYYSNIGFNAAGMKSYYFMEFGENSGFTEMKSFSSYEIEGGISYALFSTIETKKYPLVLGSEMTGYRTQTSYYVNLDIPMKQSVSVRAGYIKNNQSYEKEDIVYGTTSSFEKDVNTIYGGVEFLNSLSVEVKINQKDIERKFGSVFNKNEFSKMYLDLLYSFSQSGNLKTEKNYGIRAGLIAGTGLFSYKLEGGYSPAEEFFASISLGTCLSYSTPGKDTAE